MKLKMVDSVAFRNLFVPRVAMADGQQTSDDLEKLFSEEQGGAMMDREEMMEAMLAKDQKSM